MTPAMSKEDALARARELLGPRGDVVALGKSRFVGRQTGPHAWDWIGHGASWEAALADVNAQLAERKKTGEALREKFSRVPVRVLDDGTLEREWHGKQYIVKRVDGGYEFAGVVHRSLTSIARTITGAASISGPRFFGVNETAVKS